MRWTEDLLSGRARLRDQTYRTWGRVDGLLLKMDPVSITTSIIALLGAAASVAKGLDKLQELRKAPLQVTAILNEITDLRLLFNIIENHAGSLPEQSSQEMLAAIHQLAERYKQSLEEIDRMRLKLFSSEKRDADGKLILSRRAWLKHRADIERLHGQLRDTRSNLNTALTALTFSKVKLLSETQLTLDTPKPLEKIFDVHGRASVRETETDGADWDTASTIVAIKTSTVSQTCAELCPCECHLRRTTPSPKWLQNTIGMLFFTYSGSPLLGRLPCNYKPCRKGGAPGTRQYTWHFPSWLVSKAVCISFTRNNLVGFGGGWTFGIPRMLADDEPIWRFLNQGTVPQVQGTLQRRSIQPYDMNKDGKSLLHFSVEWRRPDMCKWLLDQGVNRFFEDSAGCSAADMAWELVLPKNMAVEKADRIREIQRLFKEGVDFSEALQFSPLHHALVLQLPDDIFEAQVQLNAKLINSRDGFGRTALTWAAVLNRPKSASALLDAGADVNVIDKHKKSALHWAIIAKAYGIAKTLLENGALTELSDEFGRTPMFEAAKTPNSQAFISLLRRFGAHIDALDYEYNRTPLHLASYHGQAANAMSLLKAGANIEARMSTGRTPLLNAVAYNQLSTTALLLRHGAHANATDKSGMTVIHLAACYGSAEIMRTLASSVLTGINIDQRDKNERSASEYMERMRTELYYGEKISLQDDEAAFKELVANTQKQNAA